MEPLTGVFDDLMALVAVIDAGGFSAASRRFDIPVSRLSRRVAALERQLGVSLLTRNARKFQVTDVGWRIYEHGLSMRAQAQDAVSIARESLDEPMGHLRVQCPMALGTSLVGSLALEFVRKYPRATLTLVTTDGRASAFSDPVDLLIQPSTRTLADSSLVARKLVDSHYLLAASPALLDALPRPTVPQDLGACPVVGWTFSAPSSRWLLAHAEQGSVEVVVEPQFTTDNLMLARDAALAGVGIAQLPEVLCHEELRTGRLQIVLPGWAPPTVAIHALFPSRRALTPGGRTFLDMLTQAFLVLGRAPA
jgi:DNA-binding transcriptional LysR family regulator